MEHFSHEYYMKRCIELAKRGMGHVAPNPMVGCLIVKNGNVISEGWHKQHGDVHAEVNALKNCSETNLSDAILYCSLEPCSHFSNTKINFPCAPQVIKSGIKHVVIGMIDPNPEVAGTGVRMMQAAGISVETGILEKECTELNEIFITTILKKRPHVMLKIAQTLDGNIATNTGDSRWVTSKIVRERVHLYRTQYDAVLVGADTVLADNPKLNVRHLEGRSPKRIVIDSKLRAPLNSVLYTDELREKTIVCTSSRAPQEKLDALHRQGVKTILFNITGDYINLKEVLYRLYELHIYSVFIEGGSRLTTAFIKEKWIDQLLLMIAPKLVGNGKRLVTDLGINAMSDAVELEHLDYEILDNHILVKGKLNECLLD